MDINAIREGLAANAGTAAGVRGYGYLPDGDLQPPCVLVQTPTVERLTMKRGSAATKLLRFDALLIVADTWDRSTQKATDGFTTAVWDALESDPTAGGTVSNLICIEAIPETRAEDGVTVGVTFTVEATTT